MFLGLRTRFFSILAVLSSLRRFRALLLRSVGMASVFAEPLVWSMSISGGRGGGDVSESSAYMWTCSGQRICGRINSHVRDFGLFVCVVVS